MQNIGTQTSIGVHFRAISPNFSTSENITVAASKDSEVRSLYSGTKLWDIKVKNQFFKSAFLKKFKIFLEVFWQGELFEAIWGKNENILRA